MAKQDDVPSYGCMMPPAGARRVEHPHDERIAVTMKPVRRLLARLASTLRR